MANPGKTMALQYPACIFSHVISSHTFLYLSATCLSLPFFLSPTHITIVIAQPEIGHDPVREVLVPGLLLARRPRQHTLPQWLCPVEEQTYDRQKTQLVPGLPP